jgi:PAS domain S-box-containing protein
MVSRYKTEAAAASKGEAVRRLIAEYEEEVAEFIESAGVNVRKQGDSARRLKNRTEATCICTPEGRIVYANGHLQHIVGYTMLDLVGENIGLLFVNAEDVESIKREIEHRGYLSDYRARLCRKDGSMLTCYISSTIRWYNDENVPGNQPLVKSWIRIAR